MPLLASIVRLALRHRGSVVALTCVFVAYGVYVLSRARYDVFPEFAPPEVSINVEAPGLTPAQVETLVTQPIENAINGMPGVVTLRSNSIQGIADVTVQFDPAADIHLDRQLVAERLAAIAPGLPQGVQPPELTPLLSSTGDLMVIGLTSRARTLMELRTLADWTIRPHLLAVPGVAAVPIYGGAVRQIQVQLDPARLVALGLSVDDVLAAARQATGVEGAGFVDTPNQRILLQTEAPGPDPTALARTVIRWRDGRAVTLGDVGRVVAAGAPPLSGATVMGRPGVLVKVSIQYGANTLEVNRRVLEALQELQPALAAQGVEVRSDLFRAANFIEVATRNMRNALLLGAALVIVVLACFLGHARTAAISCAAIPLSLLAAVVTLEKLGYSLNTMTLGGLAIAIGEVVDDAVIGVENILRRWRENRARPQPRPALAVVLDASIEVRGPVVFAACAVVLVFLPIMSLGGLAGRLFAPLGAAYLSAILASLVVALTITPALCLLWLRPAGTEENEAPLARWLRARYQRLLARIENRWIGALAAVVILTAVGLAALPLLSGSFLPALRENHLILHMTMASGTSVAASQRQGELVSAVLLAVPGVRAVSAQAGRAELDDVRGPQSSEFDIDLRPGADPAAAQTAIYAALAGVPGADYALNSFLTERVNETLSGTTAAVAVNLFGNDLAALDTAAGTVARVLQTVPGAASVQRQSPPGTPQVTIRLRTHDLERWGLTPVSALDAVRVAFEGAVVGQVHRGNETQDIVVILDPAARGDPAAVGRLLLRNGAGVSVPLAQVADVFMDSGRYLIQHQAARRVQTVTCDVRGRPVGAFVAAARPALAAAHLPAGVIVDFAGSAAAQGQARRDLLMDGALAAIGIVLLLGLALRHRNNLLLVLLNLPFAVVGGLLAVLIFGEGELSLGTLVGLVTVYGITLRNAIMLLSHYRHLVAVEGQPWGAAAAARGAAERLVPILMTALVTALGLLPLALGRHAAGREIEGPMALVILGGLATSTALNLLVMPALCLRFGRFAAEDESESGE